MTTNASAPNETILSYASPQSSAARRFTQRWPWVIGNFVVMIAIVGFSIWSGLILRRMAWEDSTYVHFRITMNSAIKWGFEANKVGVLNVYQKTLEEVGDDLQQEPGDGRLALDYPPLRLLVIAKWEAWTEQEHYDQWSKPKAQRARLRRYALNPNSPLWINEYEFNEPMLTLNTACELSGAVAMFLLVHYWLRQCSGAPSRQWIQPLRGAWPALFSALLVWFSPAVIFSAHSYPQWDVWILPPFLLAVYFGMLDLWLLSGICIGVVSMGKGQILLVTPVLIIWQLLMLSGNEIVRLGGVAFANWRRNEPVGPPLLEMLRLLITPLGAVFRLVIGILFAIALVASPWLVGDATAVRWVKWIVVAIACLTSLFFLRKWSAKYLYIQGSVILLGLCILLWPWISKPRPDYFGWCFLGAVALIVAARFLPRRWVFTWIATGITTAIFACVYLFNTSMAWYTIGIKFPTEHWQLMYWCHAMNLGAIMQEDFGWKFASMIDLGDYLPWFFPLKSPVIQTAALLLEAGLILFGVLFLAIKRSIKPHLFFISVMSLAIVVLMPFTASSSLQSFAASHINTWIADDQEIPFRYLMIAAYFVSLLLCGIGMAIHYRRRDRMFFFAMVAPWVLMYTLLPQMQNRYLVWGAAFAAATASFSLDGFMLYLLINALNLIDIAWDMCYRAQSSPTADKWMPYLDRKPNGQPLFGGIGPLFPDAGYAAILIAGIYLYLSLKRDKKRVPQPSRSLRYSEEPDQSASASGSSEYLRDRLGDGQPTGLVSTT